MDNNETPSASDAAQLIKVEFHHSRQEGVTYEELVEFCKTKWLPAALPIMKRHGIVHFSMTFSDPEEKASLREQIQAAGFGEGVTVSDFDVVSTYYVHDRNNLLAMQADPEWRDGPATFQEPVVAMSPGLFIIGRETKLI